jgi:hypothetical protein
MGFSNIILLNLAAFTLAEPMPQATTDSGSSPSDVASMSDDLASLSSIQSVMSGMPTLDPSAESVILTAIPTGV